MASRIKNSENLPPWALPAAAQIERLGFRWEFEWKYPLPHPDKLQRIQIRDVEQAPPSEVTRYKDALHRGDQFPPGVVTRDGRSVDFNTRARAAWKLGWPDFPVFILNVSAEDATDEEMQRLYLLGGAFNTHGPKPLTRAEISALVREVAKNPDWTAERVGTHLNITKSIASNVFAQYRAEQRAERLNIKMNGGVSASNRTLLGQRSDKLNDPVFAAIVQLAQDAGLTHNELRDLCNRVQDAPGSDADKIAVVDAERQARESQIANFKAMGKTKPPLASELLKRTRYIQGFEGRIRDLLDYNPNSRDGYLASVEAAMRVLATLCQEQRNVNDHEEIAA